MGGVEALLASTLPTRLRRLTLTGASDAPPYPSASIVTGARFEAGLSELTLSRFLLTADDARALPPVLVFHALQCDYGEGAKEALKERWRLVRTT